MKNSFHALLRGITVSITKSTRMCGPIVGISNSTDNIGHWIESGMCLILLATSTAHKNYNFQASESEYHKMQIL